MVVARRGSGGGSEQDEIDRLRPFNKLRRFHGVRSIRCVMRTTIRAKFRPKYWTVASSHTWPLVGRFVNSPRMLSQYTKDA